MYTDKEIILKQRRDNVRSWLKEYQPYLKDIKNIFEIMICDDIIKHPGSLKVQFPAILKKAIDEKSEVILDNQIIKNEVFNPIWESIEKNVNKLLGIQKQISKLMKNVTEHPQDINGIEIVKEELEVHKSHFDKLENEIKDTITTQVFLAVTMFDSFCK